MLRLIKARWPYPDTPEPPVFMASGDPGWHPVPAAEPLRQKNQSYADFLDAIGLVGMGGSMFPAARKLAACRGVHTVVINAVECEPGITIDRALLLHHAEFVKAGAEASLAACGARRIVIAIARNRRLARALKARYPYAIVSMPTGYPGGAERLIVKKLSGQTLPPEIFPGQIGYLVQNVASLRAIGRALIDNIPVVERPLTVAAPHRQIHHDVIVPVGMRLGDVVEACGVTRDEDNELLVAGGLMMGKAQPPSAHVLKGTTSIMLMPRSALVVRETHCINCGACNAACPLSLHPIGMVNPVRKEARPLPASVATQLNTCFLCGACAAVCPARIPLVKHIREGKACPRIP
jgi:electron transport complex protein RnfC